MARSGRRGNVEFVTPRRHLVLAAHRAVIGCALVVGACAAPRKLPKVEFLGPSMSTVSLGGIEHLLPCDLEVEPERALPWRLSYDDHVVTGLLAVGYEPRARLVVELDRRVLDAVAAKELTLLGWSTDFLGERDLVFVASALRVAPDGVAVRELAERYTGGASPSSLAGVFGWSVLAAMAGGGGPGPRATIDERHPADATWLDDEGVLHGARAGDLLAFVRARDTRTWIGPLRWRRAEIAEVADAFEVDLRAALPARPPPPTFAVGDGRNGAAALGLVRTRAVDGTVGLRLSAAWTVESAEVLVVAVEDEVVSAPSSASAKVVEVAQGRRVIVWAPRADELASGALELTWRAAGRKDAP